MIKFVFLSVIYLLAAGLVFAAGFFPVIALAGHSGILSGIAAGLVWAAYALTVLLAPWPAVQRLRRRFERFFPPCA